MRGIALLISVIIVSIVLAVSVGVSNIVSTEISLSNTSRQSQLAFYAADTGVDCAIYWDTINDGGPGSAFATSSSSQNEIECAGDNFNVGGWASCTGGLTGDEPTSPCTSTNDKKAGRTIWLMEFQNNSCAIVGVLKRENTSNPPDKYIETFIHADGYASGISGGPFVCDPSNPRAFQRSIETTIFE